MSAWPYGTAQWKRLRLAHLSIEPLCRGCKAMGGRLTPGSHVDHVKPISDGGPPFPGHDGLATYCHACHSAKTARGVEAGAIRSAKPRKGCDAAGNPLDPMHPWSAGKSLRAGEKTPCGDKKTQLVTSRSGSEPRNG